MQDDVVGTTRVRAGRMTASCTGVGQGVNTRSVDSVVGPARVRRQVFILTHPFGTGEAGPLRL